MADELEVTVNLTNQKVRFTGISTSNLDSPITFDFKPPLGDGQGYTGLELLLMSLAGCSATAVLYLLRSMKKNIVGFSVNARGIRRDQHPKSLEKIFLKFFVNSEDTCDLDVQKAIQLADETYCPVWAMLKNNVEIIAEFKIEASKGEPESDVYQASSSGETCCSP